MLDIKILIFAKNCVTTGARELNVINKITIDTKIQSAKCESPR